MNTTLKDLKADKRREEIVFGREVDWEEVDGEIMRFEELSVEDAKTLVKEGYMDPDGTQNYSPPMKEIIAFMERYPEVTAHGYMIAPGRHDARVTLEGVKYKGAVTEDMKDDFEETFRYADQKEVEWYYLYCWYD